MTAVIVTRCYKVFWGCGHPDVAYWARWREASCRLQLPICDITGGVNGEDGPQDPSVWLRISVFQTLQTCFWPVHSSKLHTRILHCEAVEMWVYCQPLSESTFSHAVIAWLRFCNLLSSTGEIPYRLLFVKLNADKQSGTGACFAQNSWFRRDAILVFQTH